MSHPNVSSPRMHKTNLFSRIVRTAVRLKRDCTHGEMILRLCDKYADQISKRPIFIETGCGISTLALARAARAFSGQAYSIDINTEKRDELLARAPDELRGVEFITGDGIEALTELVRTVEPGFLFLDSAASAMHTFREFLACEQALHAGACLLVDNAALPCTKKTLSPVRKGKILVPYLLASAFWEVQAYPRAGDSMIAAIRHADPSFADAAYEDPEFMGNWRALFDHRLPA